MEASVREKDNSTVPKFQGEMSIFPQQKTNDKEAASSNVCLCSLGEVNAA